MVSVIMKGSLIHVLDEKVVAMMNTTFAKVYWPILIFFLWHEKTTESNKGLTPKILKENLFSSETIRVHMAYLANAAKKPLLEVKENVLTHNQYFLTPLGRKLAEMQWNTLNGFTKLFMNKTMEEIVRERRSAMQNFISIKEGEIDDESLFLKEMDEANKRAEEARKKKAGIVETPNGLVVDLAKVKV